MNKNCHKSDDKCINNKGCEAPKNKPNPNKPVQAEYSSKPSVRKATQKPNCLSSLLLEFVFLIDCGTSYECIVDLDLLKKGTTLLL